MNEDRKKNENRNEVEEAARAFTEQFPEETLELAREVYHLRQELSGADPLTAAELQTSIMGLEQTIVSSIAHERRVRRGDRSDLN